MIVTVHVFSVSMIFLQKAPRRELSITSFIHSYVGGCRKMKSDNFIRLYWKFDYALRL